MMMAKAPAQPGLWRRGWVWKTVAAVVIFVAGVSVGMSGDRDSSCESLGPGPAVSVSVAVTP